jgi:hypothetical protein
MKNPALRKSLTHSFIADVCPGFRHVHKILAGLKRKFPKKKWPQKDPKKQFQLIDRMLDLCGHEKGTEGLIT